MDKINLFTIIIPTLFETRQTLKEVLNNTTRINIYLIIYICGIISGLINMQYNQLQSSTDPSLLNSLVFKIVSILLIQPITAIFFLFITGFLFSWCGTIFNGDASQSDIRKIIALGNIPILLLIPVILVDLLIYGENFLNMTYRQNVSDPIMMVISGFLGIIKFAMGVWGSTIILVGISEAHKFSIAKSIGTILIAALLSLTPIIAIIYFIKSAS